MKTLKDIAVTAFWIFVCCAISAGLLYSFAYWTATHTSISIVGITKAFEFGFPLLFFPTVFLVEFLYRRVQHLTSESNHGDETNEMRDTSDRN